MSLYLGAVIGWYLVIVSLLLLFRRDVVSAAMSEIMVQRGLFFVFAVITLILGLIMVVGHNIWVIGWPVVVTLFSWLVLISGLLRLLFPDLAIKMGHGLLNHPIRITITGVVFLSIGVYLLFSVYWN